MSNAHHGRSALELLSSSLLPFSALPFAEVVVVFAASFYEVVALFFATP